MGFVGDCEQIPQDSPVKSAQGAMMPYVKDDAGEIREQIEKEKGNEYRSNLFSQKREERLVFDEDSRYDEKERTYVHEVETLRVNGVFPSNQKLGQAECL